MKAYSTLLIILAASSPFLWVPNAVADDLRVGNRQYVREANDLFVRDRIGDEWEVAPGTVLVRFSSSASTEQINACADSHRLMWKRHRANATGYFLFQYEQDRDPLSVINELINEPIVIDACPDTKIKLWGTNDHYYSRQWNLRKTRMDRAWEVTTGGSSLIAIIDLGIDYEHEDLRSGMWKNTNDMPGGGDTDADSSWYGQPMVDDTTGWDFVDDDNDPRPANSGDYHGTTVAGVVSATRNNGIGIAGVLGAGATAGSKFMTLRTARDSASQVAPAIEYAWRKGATVINMSFGLWSDPSNAVATQIDLATAHGVILVAAVGNGGEQGYPSSHVTFPATHTSVIAVGATDSSDVRWTYSSSGSELDIMAPSGRHVFGYELWTTDNYQTPGDNNPSKCSGGCPPENPKYYSIFTGTSAASPAIAGIAALIKSHMPGLTPAQVRQRLIDSAVDLGDVGPDSLYGYGRVDAYRALTEWGTITGNVTWSSDDTADSTRYISGDLTIAPGATLTIEPGVIVKIAKDDDLRAGADTNRVEINVQGTLNAGGTSADPIVFQAWNAEGTDDWVGLYFDSTSAGGTFDHCRISHAEIGIESWVPVTVTNTVIDSSLCAGMLSRRGGALLRGCTISNMGYLGVSVESDSLLVRSTVVDGAAAFGISAAIAGFVDVDSACTITNNDIGVFLSQSESSVKASSISDNTTAGIMCDDGDTALIQSNTMTGNGVGVYCSFSSPTIKDNTIASNGTGVSVSGPGSDPDIGHYSSSGNNTISLSTYKHIVNFETQSTVSAQNNCWGNSSAPCGPPQGKIYGSVDVSHPYCCSQSLVATLPKAADAPSVETGIRSVVPNPFNPVTAIHYDLASPGAVDIQIYDVAGRLVRKLVSGPRPAGTHQATWTGLDQNGTPVASGVYFVQMKADRQTFTRKLVLLK